MSEKISAIRENLRIRLKERGIIEIPIAFDCLSAKLVEKTGFDVVGFGGFASAATFLGMPDVGLLGMSELLLLLKNMCNSVNIAVSADAETGFGGILNVKRTVEEFEEAGAALIFIEDQELELKRCGHMNGKKVVPLSDMLRKIKAACAARKDKNLIIVGRTDSREKHGLEDAIERGRAMFEAGADAVFIEAPQSAEEMQLINKELKGIPLVANAIEGGKTPVLSSTELEKIGFKFVLFPTSALFLTAQVLKDLFSEIKKTGKTEKFKAQMAGFDSFQEIVELDKLRDFEKRINGD